MNNFLKRLTTGFLFITLVIFSIWMGEWWLASLLGVVVFVGMYEFYRMLNLSPVSPQKVSAFVLGGLAWLITSLVDFAAVDNRWFLLLVPATIAVFIIELYREKEKPFWNIAATLLIPLYVVLPFIFLQKLALVNDSYNRYLLLAFFGMVWVNDTGAYLVGVSIGKRRLFPRISPKKSWEGFVGGVIFTVALAYGVSTYINIYPTWLWLVVGVVISVFGTLGDLTESMLKRSVDVKDSGNILPGHGGVLDRFDAVTFAAPLVYVLFNFFM